MKLIIANARRKGGLSGSDNIYENLAENWNCKVVDMRNIDFQPFMLCYIWRIILAVVYSCCDNTRWDIVYTGSDFWMDTFAGFIYKLKGIKWVASFYLYAPKENWIYYWSQKVAYLLIKKYADVVCITNDNMKWGFMDKKTVSVNGGVDFKLAGLSGLRKTYDAVFCGRIHKTKGVEELIMIWKEVVNIRPKAKLAVIGDGDLGQSYVYDLMRKYNLSLKNVHVLGYLGDLRYDIYKQSKMVLYPTKHNHFSMAPVEAMACGCPLVAFKIPVMKDVRPQGCILVNTIGEYSRAVISLMDDYLPLGLKAYEWSKGWDWEKRRKDIANEIKSKLVL